MSGDPPVISADELDRALEATLNTGGWSYDEAELMARALRVTAGTSVIRLSDGSLIIGLRHHALARLDNEGAK